MWRILLLLLAVLSFVGTALAQSEPRLALVIGNAVYDNKAIALANPVNDAKLMASTLKGAGFEVMELNNANFSLMQSQLDVFLRRLNETRGVGFFYYSGQGIGINREHHLSAIDVDIKDADSIKQKSLTLRSVRTRMFQSLNKLNIVVVDASSADAFNTLKPEDKKDGVLLVAPPRMLLAVSAKPLSVAMDGKGKNGLYTEILANEINQPGAELSNVFKQTTFKVQQQSGNAQDPWVYAFSLDAKSPFIFKPQAMQQAAARNPPPAYRLLEDGVAYRADNNLYWQRCPLGQTLNAQRICVGEAKFMSQAQAKQAATQLNQAGGQGGICKWRLPTLRELHSLVYCSKGADPKQSGIDVGDGGASLQSCAGMTVGQVFTDTAVFPHDAEQPIAYWTDTQYFSNDTSAWLVGFLAGNASGYHVENSYAARFVSSIGAGNCPIADDPKVFGRGARGE